MKKILVFGGSGFIGSHVVEELLKRNYQVLNFDLVDFAPNEKRRYSFFQGSIMDYPVVSNTICEYHGCDAIFNFAAMSDMEECRVKPLDAIRKNVLGNQYILQGIADYLTSGIRKPTPPKFLFASSLHVYNKESGPYGISKRTGEECTEEYAKGFGFSYVLLRIGTVYGPRAKNNNAIKSIVKGALKTKDIVYRGDKKDSREYIFVKDLACYVVDIMESNKYENLALELAGTESIEAEKLLCVLKEILGREYATLYKNNKRSHYKVTPYRQVIEMGKRYVGDLHHDLGAGLLEVIEEVSDES